MQRLDTLHVMAPRADALLDAAMAFIRVRVPVNGMPRRIGRHLPEDDFGVALQTALISFESHEVVRAFAENLPGDGPLRAHGVQRYHAAGDVDQVEQFRN